MLNLSTNEDSAEGSTAEAPAPHEEAEMAPGVSPVAPAAIVELLQPLSAAVAIKQQTSPRGIIGSAICGDLPDEQDVRAD